MLSYKIIQDPFAENPLGKNEIYSFNPRHENYINPADLNIQGNYYFLSYLEHSGLFWRLKDKSRDSEWINDSGIIVADSEEEAQAMLNVYNAYLNGDCWGWEIAHDGKHYDSRWGYYSYQDAEDTAKERMEEVEEEIIDEIGRVLEGV